MSLLKRLLGNTDNNRGGILVKVGDQKWVVADDPGVIAQRVLEVHPELTLEKYSGRKVRRNGNRWQN